MISRSRAFACFAAMALMSLSHPSAAQMFSGEQPVVYSKTVIALVPAHTIPKKISQSPELQGEVRAEELQEPTLPATEADTENGVEAAVALPKQQRHTITVQVRPSQISLDSGMINNYILDANNAVLTYFTLAEPRSLLAENIQKPLDILFVRDDGTIVQIVPEVIPAYLPDDIGTDFPLRALLYLEAGLAEKWGIEPGYRIEHGMFNPKPIIYVAPGSESNATVQ